VREAKRGIVDGGKPSSGLRKSLGEYSAGRIAGSRYWISIRLFSI
jgi:hypothetical protein